MFVEVHDTLPMPVEDARRAVERALCEHAALQQHSQEAVAGGWDLTLEVGPAHLFAKTVRARALASRQVGGTTVIPLRWEASGPTAALFPMLDANIGITASDEHTSILSLIGTYTPPLGVLGATLDRAAMSHIARATVVAFLKSLVAEATAGSAHA
jgi:hypothetical protein